MSACPLRFAETDRENARARCEIRLERMILTYIRAEELLSRKGWYRSKYSRAGLNNLRTEEQKATPGAFERLKVFCAVIIAMLSKCRNLKSLSFNATSTQPQDGQLNPAHESSCTNAAE
jgi:hypothetical protein